MQVKTNESGTRVPEKITVHRYTKTSRTLAGDKKLGVKDARKPRTVGKGAKTRTIPITIGRTKTLTATSVTQKVRFDSISY